MATPSVVRNQVPERAYGTGEARVTSATRMRSVRSGRQPSASTGSVRAPPEKAEKALGKDSPAQGFSGACRRAAEGSERRQARLRGLPAGGPSSLGDVRGNASGPEADTCSRGRRSRWDETATVPREQATQTSASSRGMGRSGCCTVPGAGCRASAPLAAHAREARGREHPECTLTHPPGCARSADGIQPIHRECRARRPCTPGPQGNV
jgi:hypothetical protein